MPATYESERLLFAGSHVTEDTPAQITTASFPQFPRLATELRLAIWRRFALPKKLDHLVRDLEEVGGVITYRDPEVSKRCGDIRRIMQVNIEARREVLQGRQLVVWENIEGEQEPSFSFINWELDTYIYSMDLVGYDQGHIGAVDRIVLVTRDGMRIYLLDHDVPGGQYRDGQNLLIDEYGLHNIVDTENRLYDKCKARLIVGREGTEDEGQQIVRSTFPCSQWCWMIIGVSPCLVAKSSDQTSKRTGHSAGAIGHKNYACDAAGDLNGSIVHRKLPRKQAPNSVMRRFIGY
ncbi:hypothetical protein F4679DRAFT_591364 [Xylaria curta]|nr:hypothetical protein F4679DRAFT_591364 [Xylaria curta]